MDLQEATALGSFVWIAGNFRGGNVSVQQRGEIAERVDDASGKLSFGRDGDGSKWGNVQRKSYAEGPIALNCRVVGVLVWDLHPRAPGSEGLNGCKLTKSLPLRAIARCSEAVLLLGVVRRY
jgi:hypothetical protein